MILNHKHWCRTRGRSAPGVCYFGMTLEATEVPKRKDRRGLEVSMEVKSKKVHQFGGCTNNKIFVLKFEKKSGNFKGWQYEFIVGKIIIQYKFNKFQV